MLDSTVWLPACVCVGAEMVKVTVCCDLEKDNPGNSGHTFPSITRKRERLVASCSCSWEDEGTEKASTRAPLLSTFTFADHLSLLRVLSFPPLPFRHRSRQRVGAAGDDSSCSEHIRRYYARMLVMCAGLPPSRVFMDKSVFSSH